MTALELLRSLEEARERIDPYAELPDEFTGELKRHALYETIHYSTRIEGNTLTLKQVQSLFSGNSVDAPQDQIQEVHNYREAVAYIQSLVVDGYPTITEETIRTIHFIVSKSLPGEYDPGRYRTTQNFVIDRLSSRRIFLPPSPDKVAPLMAEYVEWLNRDDDAPAVYKAALAHLNLVAINPFSDGNGRTARVVDSLVMYRGGFKSRELVSLEAYFGRDTQGYYDALRAALSPSYSPQRDVTVWIDYYLEAHTRQAEQALKEIRQMTTELNGLYEILIPQGLTGWQISTLWLATRRGQMTNREYRSISGRSNITAWADLSKLVKAGWLDRTGRGRSVVYRPTDKAVQLIEKIVAEASMEIELN
jgi:Fic family protein